MTMYEKRCPTTSSRSLRRKWASNSPTRRASSFASAIRAGAIQRFSCGEGRITSVRAQPSSTMASYTVRTDSSRCTKEIVLLPCGSRSMRRVDLPRSASAEARLMAVVVLPTPPFWLAIATIICRSSNEEDRDAATRAVPEPCASPECGHSRNAPPACQGATHGAVRSTPCTISRLQQMSAGRHPRDGRSWRYILYLPSSSGSRFSSHLASRSESALSGTKSRFFAFLTTVSST